MAGLLSVPPRMPSMHMPCYRIFGKTVQSAVAFSELLPVAPMAPDVRVLQRQAGAPPPLAGSHVLGREPVHDGVEVSLFSAPGTLRLVFDDTGTFDITEGGTRIEWTSRPDADLDAVRKDLLGRVIAAALHQEGILGFHGSAVAFGGTALAFLAPKGYGKSTLAAALVGAGGHFLADDLVATQGDETGWTALPGIPALHLRLDAADHLRHIPLIATTPDTPASQGKLALRPGAPPEGDAPRTLGAVYLLTPCAARPGDPVSRHQIPPARATVALLSQVKLGVLLGTEGQAELLPQVAKLAQAVPVYWLTIPRDLACVGDVAAVIAGWHGTPSPPPVP